MIEFIDTSATKVVEVAGTEVEVRRLTHSQFSALALAQVNISNNPAKVDELWPTFVRAVASGVVRIGDRSERIADALETLKDPRHFSEIVKAVVEFNELDETQSKN
jgi:hypothetical protein